MSHITVDPKHGLNPGLELCFYCQEPKGIVLYGAIGHTKRKAFKEAGIDISADGEAPRKLTLNREPCDKCKELMEQGVILISCREVQSEEEKSNPYRTGGWVVVKDRLIEDCIGDEETKEAILRMRVAFIPDAVWDKIGLPRGDVDAKATH